MHLVRLTALLLFALGCLGFQRKEYPVQVRFFAEANRNDTERFATPIELRNPKRSTFIEKIPAISERNIKAIYPFRAADGTMGCAFKLDASGRVNLDVVSTERRGSSLVAFVSTKAGTHQVIDMVIDRTVKDGIITIQRGLTELEIVAITKQWPTLNAQNLQSEN